MEDIRELKTLLSGELEESFRRGIVNNMPCKPMAIIYTDDEAKKAKEEIDSVLQDIWRDKKKAIVQLVLEEGSFLDADSGAALEEGDVQDMIDNMYALENSFQDKGRLCMVFIHSTTSCEDADEFSERFGRVRQIKDLFEDNISTTAIVLLEESGRYRKTAAEIKNYLGGLLKEGNDPYSSTFLLSNRLSNGDLLAGKRIRENYAMAGWIILLLNGIGAGYKPDDLGLVYPGGKEYCLTAAFSEKNRPNNAICDIVLHAMLMWIDRRMHANGKTQNKKLDIEDLYQRLEISGNQAKFLEDFFRQNIADKIPSADALKYLPRRQMGGTDITIKDFRTVNQETMGGCSAFIDGLRLFDRQMRDDFAGFFQSYIQARMSAAERERAFSVSNIQEILRQLSVPQPTGKERLDIYLQEKIHADYIKWALPVCEEVFRREQKNSAAHAKEFEEVLQEFQQGYFPDDPNLESYYADVTADQLERAAGGLGERLMKEIALHGEDRSTILDCLRRAAQEIFSAKDVFHMPLEQEMVSRMGKDPNNIHNEIYNALFRNLGDRIRLKTPIALSDQKQIIIVNQREADGAETALYKSIRGNVSDGANMIYFDSCNSNTIKILRFYACGYENLMRGENKDGTRIS